jgi:ribosomal protein L16 Arg81 hydroxylase
MRLTLGSILNPLDIAEFLAKHWQREMYLCSQEKDFSELVCLSDVDHLVASAAAVDDVIIVSPNMPVPKHLNRIVTLSSAYEAYSEGDSILLTKLERRWEAVAKTCQLVATELKDLNIQLERNVGANLYLTPPCSQAFPPHFDDHEVVILQLEGSKRWKIFEHSAHFPPTRQTERIPSSALPKVISEINLTAGQAMYIPMGAIHEAKTSGEYSLHLTLSLFPGKQVIRSV